MNKKTLSAMAIGLILYGGAALAVDPTEVVEIDFDGTNLTQNGGTTSLDSVLVGSLDWDVGTALADDALVSNGSSADPFDPANFEGNTFDIYVHAELIGYKDENFNAATIPGLTSAFEWTVIFGGTETITDVEFSGGNCVANCGTIGDGDDILELVNTQTYQGGNQDSSSGFFFEIYYDGTPDADNLSGLGYDNGDLIMRAELLDTMSGDFSATIATFTDLDGDGTLSSLAEKATVTLLDTDNTQPNSYDLLDSAGSDNWSTAQITYLSVTGEGGTQLEALLDTDGDGIMDGNALQDGNFFLTSFVQIISDLVFTTENDTPFTTTQPSKSLDCEGSIDDAGCAGVLSLANGGLLIGQDGTGHAINGVLGPDVLFMTDANQGFRTTTRQVPEPSTIALLGLSLGFLGLPGLRRRRSQASS